MDKFSHGFDFVVALNVTFSMYSISQLKVLGRFKRIKKIIFSPSNLSLKFSNYWYYNIFTAKIYKIILNGKTLLYSGLS